MKVVLLKNIPTLGAVGDVRDVSEGYARNFLIPKKFATSATREALVEGERVRK